MVFQVIVASDGVMPVTVISEIIGAVVSAVPFPSPSDEAVAKDISFDIASLPSISVDFTLK